MRNRTPAGWTKIRATKLHSFRNKKVNGLVRQTPSYATHAIYTEGNMDWTCVKVGRSWFKTDEYEYNGR